MSVIDEYTTYLNPLVGEILGSIGVEKWFVRAENHTMSWRDAKGREGDVVDLACGYGSLIFGHNHPELVGAAKGHLDGGLPIHAQFSPRQRSAELAHRINELALKYTGVDYMVRFANSGAEAVDLAVKHCEFRRVLKIQEMMKKQEQALLALEKAVERGECTIPGDLFKETELREQIFADKLTTAQFKGYLTRLNAKAHGTRPLILALRRAFHGKTIGACQMTFSETFRRAFMYMGINTVFLDPENAWEMEDVLDGYGEPFFDFEVRGETVLLLKEKFPLCTALLVEPIQGEGGVRVIDSMVLKDLRSICDDRGIPLILDEIQCGMGRTGRFLASQHQGVAGDCVLIGKSLGGGIAKISAVLIRREQYQKPFGVIHTSTFAEDEFSSSIGLKVLEMLERDDGEAYRKAEAIGNRLKEGLEELRERFPEVVAEVRGTGLMLGIEFVDPADADSPVLRNLSSWKALGYTMFSWLHERQGIRILPTSSANTTLRLEPGVTITDEQVAKVLAAIGSLCETLQAEDGYQMTYHLTSDDMTAVKPELLQVRSGEHARKLKSVRALEPAARIAFVGHPLDLKSVGGMVPELARMTQEGRERMYARNRNVRANPAGAPIRIHSQHGREVEIHLYSMNKTAEQLVRALDGTGLDDIRECLNSLAKKVREDGCQVLGLGGFTSIVTSNGKTIDAVPGLAVTTGNALTTGLAHQAMLNACAKLGRSPFDSSAAVVGGAGNIGQVLASLLAEHSPRILLVGSGRSGSLRRLEGVRLKIWNDIGEEIARGAGTNLRGIAARVADKEEIRDLVSRHREAPLPDLGKRLSEAVKRTYGGEDPLVEISDSLDSLKEAPLIACATNSPAPFLQPSHVAEGTVVCDLGVPSSLVEAPWRELGVEVFHGGLAKLPKGQAISASSMNVSEGHAFGCLTETIVMGLLGMREHYSYGDITRTKVREITALATSLGFGVAEEYRAHTHY